MNYHEREGEVSVKGDEENEDGGHEVVDGRRARVGCTCK